MLRNGVAKMPARLWISLIATLVVFVGQVASAGGWYLGGAPVALADPVNEDQIIPSATESPLPALGQVFYQDDLAATIFRDDMSCPSGLNSAKYTREGLVFRVTGLCQPEDPYPRMSWMTSGLDLNDGELRFSFRAVENEDRARLRVEFRSDNAGKFTTAELGLGDGSLDLTWQTPDGEEMTVSRQGLRDWIRSDQWNTLAMRGQGSKVWVLLNEQLVVEAETAPIPGRLRPGGMVLGVVRSGGIEDTAETAVMFRDLHVSYPAPTEPPDGPCMGFVIDVTIPDGTRTEPGHSFEKVWRLVNCGRASWEGYRAVRTRGEIGPVEVAVPTTPSGQSVDITMEMQAPSTPGRHRSLYELEGPNGRVPGAIGVDIDVAK
jgi:hypothetical protein